MIFRKPSFSDFSPVCLVWRSFLAIVSLAFSAHAVAQSDLMDIRFGPSADGTRIVFDLHHAPDVRVSPGDEGARSVILDLDGIATGAEGLRGVAGKGLVERVQYLPDGKAQTRFLIAFSNDVRILDLFHLPSTPQIRKHRLVIDVATGSPTQFRASLPAEADRIAVGPGRYAPSGQSPEPGAASLAAVARPAAVPEQSGRESVLTNRSLSAPVQNTQRPDNGKGTKSGSANSPSANSPSTNPPSTKTTAANNAAIRLEAPTAAETGPSRLGIAPAPSLNPRRRGGDPDPAPNAGNDPEPSAGNNPEPGAGNGAEKANGIGARVSALFKPKAEPTPKGFDGKGVPTPGYREWHDDDDRMVIIIDPGHGGSHPGAIGPAGTLEKEVNLAAAKALAEILSRNGHYRVALTRSGDERVELDERAEFARVNRADLFVSIHADGNRDKTLRGSSVYTLSEAGAQRSEKEARERKSYEIDNVDVVNHEIAPLLFDLAQERTLKQSDRFAGLVLAELASVTPLVKNANRQEDLKVLLRPDIPAILLEMAFISNPDDERNLNSAAWRSRAMSAVADAIDAYFGVNRRSRHAAGGGSAALNVTAPTVQVDGLNN